MTPPVPASASQCRRALQRHISQARDSIWITDGLLDSAFERYCRVSRTWNRKASNVPGPLESQRRLGRRRMGDASTWCCPPAPPSWAFPVPLNLSQWTWKPPSLAREQQQHDRPQDGHDGLGALAALLPQWLRTSMPREAHDPPVTLVDDWSSDRSLPPVDARFCPSYTADVDAFRWAAGNADDQTFAVYTIKICHKLQQLIILGDISPQVLSSLSDEIWRTIGSRLHRGRLGNRLSVTLCETLAHGFAISRVFSPDRMEARFWNTLLVQMSRLGAKDAIIELFVKVMMIVPAKHIPHISEGILSILGCFFAAWNRSILGQTASAEARVVRRLLDSTILGTPVQLLHPPRIAKAIPKGLRAVSTTAPEGLLLAAQRLALANATGLAEGRHALRYLWLYALAQMPGVTQRFLFDAATALSDPSVNTRPLTGLQICSLLLTQWWSRGYLSNPDGVHRSFRKHADTKPDEAALASLILAVFRYEENEAWRRAHYYSMWELLGNLGRTSDVVQSLKALARSTPLPVQMLEVLATTSDDRYVAIQLHDLWARRLKKPQDPQWYPGVFHKYARDIVHDPRIPPKTVWRVLDICRLERQSGLRAGSRVKGGRRRTWRDKTRSHRGTFGERRAAVVEEVIKAFATAPHLSNRVALRHVTQGAKFIQLVRGQFPKQFIRVIYALVTRDLWERKPGRTKRLLWFLRLVERVYGLEVAWACRLAVRRWRAKLKACREGKGSNT